MVALWLAALALGSQAETTVVRGRVIEVGSERPIAGARLAVGEQEVFSDAEGRFRLALAPGPWTLEVESDRHLSDRIEIVVGVSSPPRAPGAAGDGSLP